MSKVKSYAICLLIALAISVAYRKMAPHYKLKDNTPLESHPSHIFPEVFSKEEFKNLQNLAKNTTFLMTTRADSQNEFEFGSQEISKDKKCAHSLLHSNLAGDKCIIPARIDVGKHLMMTGGYGGKKENYEKLIGRAKFFQHFWGSFNPEDPEIMPEVLDLFKKEYYEKEADKICQSQKFRDPMQASILVALPGQEVGLHYDTPWFEGADRNVFPIWLLVAMKRSLLYEDISINQVQGVAYLHEWTNAEVMGGGFQFYKDGPAGAPTLVEAKPNRGLIVDGTVMAHGTQTFIPKSTPINVDKDKDYKIKYNSETKKWDVHELDTGVYFNSYNDDEVRLTLVWRQRCFDDEQGFEDFKVKNVKSKQLDVKQVFDNLLNNLLKTGAISSIPKEEIDQIQTVIDGYVKYPYPEIAFPYNYCMASKLFPSVKPLLDLIC